MYINSITSFSWKQLLAFSLIAILSAVLTIAVFESSIKVTLVVFGGLGLVVGLFLSGNPRLYCLWGLFLTFPLSLNKSFLIIPHMGGASAISIDLVDIFIIPLSMFLLRDFSQGHRRQVRFSGFTFYWGALIALGVITIIVGPMREVAFLEVVRMLKLLLLFLVIVNEVVRVKQFIHVVAALTVGIAFQSIIGLIQFTFDVTLGAELFGETPIHEIEYTSRATYTGGGFTYRVGALLGHPNILAIYLAMLMPISIAMLYTNIKASTKLVTVGVVAIGAVVLVLTLSRAAWLGFAVGMLLFIAMISVHKKLRYRRIVSRVAMVLSGFVALFAMSGPILKRLFESDSGAIDFRWEIIGWTLNMISDKPFLGFGLNSYVWHMPPYSVHQTHVAVMDRFGDLLPVVHNIYLLVMVEQGVIGLLFFIGLHIYLLRLCWLSSKNMDMEMMNMINIGCMCGLMVLVVDGVASFFIRIDSPGRIFTVVAALIVAIHYWQKENSVQLKRFQEM